MFLSLAHNKLDIFSVTRSFERHCYLALKLLPAAERFNMIQQLKRAAFSTQLNIGEGSSKRSEADRRRFYEIARGSLIEADAILDAGENLHYWNREDLMNRGDMRRVFRTLSTMIVYPA